MKEMRGSRPQKARGTPTRAEEGEQIGTLKQFARVLEAPLPSVLGCAESHEHAIVLHETDGQPVFILDSTTLAAVARCAENE